MHFFWRPSQQGVFFCGPKALTAGCLFLAALKPSDAPCFLPSTVEGCQGEALPVAKSSVAQALATG